METKITEAKIVKRERKFTFTFTDAEARNLVSDLLSAGAMSETGRSLLRFLEKRNTPQADEIVGIDEIV